MLIPATERFLCSARRSAGNGFIKKVNTTLCKISLLLFSCPVTIF